MDTAIILAAGVGSRMGEIDTHKCLLDIPRINTNTLDNNIRQLEDEGVSQIIIVVGHLKDQVIDYVTDQDYSSDILFVWNEFYDSSGCNYSLSYIKDSSFNISQLLIIEADTIYPKGSFRKLLQSSSPYAVLGRPTAYINYTRSVVVAHDKIDDNYYFVYDPSHENVYDMLDENEEVVAESLQVWKLAGDPLSKFLNLISEYREMADSSESRNHSGVYTLNELSKIYSLDIIMTDSPASWTNVNTKYDIY